MNNNSLNINHEYKYDESKIFTKKGIQLIKDYIDKTDWRVNENSNVGYSLSGLNNYIANTLSALYWLYDIYDEEIREAHKNADIHIHDLGVISSYCTGWDAKDILMYGFGGVFGKIQSAPPKHLRTALGQIWNFMYSIANEVAGAVAMNNFDTLLAPFIYYDNLSYEEVKQCIQEFVYNMNVPTRSGFQCVSEDTEILTNDGWKKYNEIKKGDNILTLNIKTKEIEEKEVLNMFVKEYEGEMYHIKTRDMDQLITPNHRVLRYMDDNELILEEIEKSYNELNKFKMIVMNNDKQIDIEINKDDIKKVNYKGIIWCPTTENETIIAKRNGKVFITGNSPFTNITLDFTVPKHLKDQPIIIGGKIMNKSYGDFQNEMDMFNDAFYEVMMEGDKNGQIFSYPIPTVNITKDFDWDNPRYSKMWEASAKFGMNYFANYIHTDMDPEDALSMCPLGKNEKIMYKEKKDDNKIKIATISELYKKYGDKENVFYAYSDGEFVTSTINKFKKRLVKIYLENGLSITTSIDHLNVAKTDIYSDIYLQYPTHQLNERCFLPFSLSVSKDLLSYEEKDYYEYFQLAGILYSFGYYDEESNKFIASFPFENGEENFLFLKKELEETKYIPKLNHFKITYEDNFIDIEIQDRSFYNFIFEYFTTDENDEFIMKDNFYNNNYYNLFSFIEGMKMVFYPKNRFYIAKEKLENIIQLYFLLGEVPYIEWDDKEDMYLVYYIKDKLKDIKYYHKDVHYHWVKIKKIIETIDIEDVYCLEILEDDKDAIFTVASSGIVTHNCRLRLDLRELQRSNTGLFSAGTKTGSIGVVSINMPRLGYISKSIEEFKEKLVKLMDIAIRALLKKREVIEKYTIEGMYPYIKFYLKDVYERHGKYWANHFNTIGIIGMNEMCLNLIGKDIASEEGLKLTKEIMEFMREKITEYQVKYQQHVNFEGVPGESLSYRFAKHDIKKYPGIITAGTKESPYYTNSCHLPVDYTDNIFEMLKHQSNLQPLFTGGIVSHIFLGEKLNDSEQAKLIIKKSVENFSLPYLSLTPTFSICPEHGYLPGEHEFCPICIEEGKSEEEAIIPKIEDQCECSY